MDHLPDQLRSQKMTEALTRKLSGFFPISEATCTVFVALCDDRVEFAPGETIVGEGARYAAIYLVESGWILRARHMESGARQIVNVAIPGDFVALNALLFTDSDFDHVARTNVSAYRLQTARARDAFQTVPNLSAALFWANVQEESMLAERIVSLGRRNALTRTAHVLCEFIARLEIIDAVTFPELVIPLSQEDFSDILGISLVHTNKVLRRLDREGVITFRNGLLIVHDRRRLEAIAGFDEGYMHFTRRGGWVG